MDTRPVSHRFPAPNESALVAALAYPSGRLRVVLDTDTDNEIDDQFALTQLLLAPERIQVEAVYAAPYHNQRSTGPEDGMEKSYHEIHRVLNHVGKGQPAVARGSTRYVGLGLEAVESEATEDLRRRARASDERLYVVAIGAATNVASALLLDPSLVEKITVVWLGGHDHHWPHTAEFNLMQDVGAASVLFESGVPLVQIPCMGVASHMLTSVPALARDIEGRTAIGSYLTQILRDQGYDQPGHEKEIWDLAATAYLIHPSFCASVLTVAPTLNQNLTYSFGASTPLMRRVYHVSRNAIFADFFARVNAS